MFVCRLKRIRLLAQAAAADGRHHGTDVPEVSFLPAMKNAITVKFMLTAGQVSIFHSPGGIMKTDIFFAYDDLPSRYSENGRRIGNPTSRLPRPGLRLA